MSILSTHQERTAIRITVIKKLNCRREDIPGQTSVLSMQGGLRLPLKVITGAVSVHHECKAVLIVLMVRRDLFVGWEMDSVSWIDFDKFFSLYGSPDFNALSYSIPIHDDRLITPDDRLITPDEDSSLKKPPSRVTVKKTTTLFMAML
ncbi:hypothetical protein ADUPG1_013648 [Aduncisulcus paluster]|uniref:Uncharacterized protein n=1 Tax=Aduncisulcus paluster TaxID=2918883 RepID=A0ABQ5K5H6_9EUKA|nr:hypothetical protein ADUPG1_013648 [Aduncisulcus paluster]